LDDGDDGPHDEPKDEYVQKINEWWRFSDDAVVMEEEQWVLIDDFDARYGVYLHAWVLGIHLL
jgi:hypothetical protein